ncbi:Probable exocyst complex component Sec5, putative [Brugia malayi]|nr:putative exocyst complex component Sec5, putative [Brugia malayi]VIO96336.1 Probable exocyst complex component Sec5, putative [Brugia malayi]
MAENADHSVSDSALRPLITGLSPKEGVPGTQIKIRGENLGRNQSDLVALSICGTDCLMSAKWKSSSLIIARIGQAKRGVGEVVLLTKSMGKSTSNVTFRVFIVQVGPLEESAVWVDETRTVPGREAVRNVPETTAIVDALGLTIESHKKMDQTSLMQMFPEGSGNLRMENFNPAWYLLENHRETKLVNLRKGLMYLTQSTKESEKSSSDLHRANLYSLINCVDTLATLYDKMQLERNVCGWPLTKNISEKLTESHTAANAVFYDVLTRKDRADATRNALSILTRFRFIFFLSSSIDQNLAKGEYSTILNDYARAKSLFKDTEVSLFKEVMTELDQKMEIFKRNMKQRLIDMPTSFEDQSKLIKYLKILEPNSDPAWDCITAYHCWLEDLLWQTQRKHLKLALDQVKSRRESSGIFSLIEENFHNLHDFVQEMVDLITDKLQIFWKLSQIYSSSVTNLTSVDRICDINQMLINTVNVSSWLILNALVPDALPESVLRKYSEQFAKWPIASSLTHQLFSSLKILRSCVSFLLDCNFTSEQLQPLLELCVTIRLKCLSKVIERVTQGVISLGNGEIWKLEHAGLLKTILPDLYETEVNVSMGQIRQILSSSNYAGELDLFSRERFRFMLIDLFTMILTSVRDCIENVLQLRNCVKRPSALFNEGTASSRKLLIAVCNIEYILSNSLPTLCRRLAENGVKYGDLIFEKSKGQLLAFRQNLMKYYLQIKCATFSSMFGSANYDLLPNEEASDYIKELVMYLIFIQSEICLLAPHVMREVLGPIIQNAFDQLIDRLNHLQNMSLEQTTQVVIDVTALEETVQNFLLLETRAVVNSFRAKLVHNLDQSLFKRSLHNFRAAMRMAIVSLNYDHIDANDSSDI